MTLRDLLAAIRTDKKKLTVELYSNAKMLLISFELSGFESIEGEILAETVDIIELPAGNVLKVYLK